ncbi:MAG: GNAT family N-acetyltransferase [Rhodothermales bacterium]
MKKLDVRAVRNGKEWREVKSIRTKVFIEEQECEPRQEWDEYETSSRQMIGLLGGKPVATARWRTVWHEERRVAKLERFAVLKEYRGKGYGRSLVEQVMDDARMAGRRDFMIHAQQHLEDFYRSFGFETVGEPFEEAGIPHVKMVRLA